MNEDADQDLRLEVADRLVEAGTTVVVPGRVTNLTDEPLRTVILAQGLPAGWCPPAHVLTLPAHNSAEVFVYLTPPTGTPVGCYPWALTAQTTQQPMQAVNAELGVRRPSPPPPETARPGHPRRRWIVVSVALGMATAVAAVLVLLRPDTLFRPLERALVLKPPRGSTGSGTTPTPTPTESPTYRGPSEVSVSIAVQADGAQDVKGIRVELTKLNLNSLSNASQGQTEDHTVPDQVVNGTPWTTTLPPGLYALTFTKTGYEPEQVVLDVTSANPATLPDVQLSRSPEKKETDDKSQQEAAQH
ncbi:hypothetical protein KIH74_04660 [Kineosporia sp. J2-2]|uniref:Alpha-galactosidase NEW3 domain-containing protein n=1 Tax=Kineosporia corallincola TaxID=2835133 RepID=A0ABS5TAZ0_9ACTN|nr:NEW3 domain-containing protein [Kineosporia corallincola]MBT0768201.1 hypothetical protein [Kineosporia corallincola]